MQMLESSPSKIYAVYIADTSLVKNMSAFTEFLSQKSGWDLDKCRNFLATSKDVRFSKLTKHEAEARLTELNSLGIQASISNDFEIFNAEYLNKKSIMHLSKNRANCISCNQETTGYKPYYYWDAALLPVGLVLAILIMAFRPRKYFCAVCGCQWEKV